MRFRHRALLYQVSPAKERNTLQNVVASLALLAPGARSRPAQRAGVDLFTALEQSWSRAISTRDAQRLEQFLAPDYSLTVAAAGGLVRVDRAAWLQSTLNEATHEFEFHELTVHEFADSAVVGARCTQKAVYNGNVLSAELLLTDIWVRRGSEWQVSARYASHTQ